ncbi:TssQ family T6SS-associated lipoprotein [Piscinibacter sp. HJYY11]|uniref:TssQ family T6SS-associated lipoprotein n=1 Tax=Piscinibacter sp. HJYY11 TaxID=2801333 RepID=UPI00191CAE16|nr:TssQ family T6SS-associated lipoprotein [Piscinibacter sp. HJYY11]MBL0730487.1 TssQ family T6SS-associated lipoprotein [Piscinibacter sp. HJYY11]
MRTLLGTTLASLVLATLAGCVTQPKQAPIGLLDVVSRPAEKALQAGLRAYDDAQYGEAEKQLNNALKVGLVSPRDQAEAHKVLAFIYCTSRRPVECEAEFRAAKASDPAFALSKSEQGHPLWGPIYKKIP